MKINGKLLTTNKSILLTIPSITIIIFISKIFGSLANINSNLIEAMNNRPLSETYFLTFIVIGFLFPLIIRFYKYDNNLYRKIIDPYLYLMISQILAELAFVYVIGKGMGVIIGLFYSTIRIIQLNNLLKLARESKFLKSFIGILFILWMTNIIQILYNRILPVIINQNSNL